MISSCALINSNGINDSKLEDWMGKKITLKGRAVNFHEGAAIVVNDATIIWIDDLSSWPMGYYEGENDSKTVKVTGVLIEKYDRPVFIYKEGQPARSGIPVPEGTDLRKASHRYLLKNSKW